MTRRAANGQAGQRSVLGVLALTLAGQGGDMPGLVEMKYQANRTSVVSIISSAI